MDPDYFEKEVKILNISIKELVQNLQNIKATKVFDAKRTITFLDNEEVQIKNSGQVLKVTEEGTIKVSISTPVDKDEKETIKFKASRKKEAIDFLNRLGFKPIAEVTQRRISFEWEGVDIDIDEFPEIPPFVEIDLGTNAITLEDFLNKLNLSNKELVTMSTPEVYEKYNKNLFELFKTHNK